MRNEQKSILYWVLQLYMVIGGMRLTFEILTYLFPIR
jgi:hypothetical protein